MCDTIRTDVVRGRLLALGVVAVLVAGCAALDDGGALVVGGSVRIAGEPGEETSVPTATAERFDPATGAWRAAGTLAVAAAERVAIRLADGRVLVAGGYTTTAELYDPASGTWSPTTPMPGPRAHAEATLLPDGSVLFAGGFSAPPGNQSTPSCPTVEPTVLRYVVGSSGGDSDG